jgi:hypothetical protein
MKKLSLTSIIKESAMNEAGQYETPEFSALDVYEALSLFGNEKKLKEIVVSVSAGLNKQKPSPENAKTVGTRLVPQNCNP